MKRVAQNEKEGAEKGKRRANTAGQIIPRGEDTWLVRIFTGRDGQGKRRYLNKTIRGKKKDAQDYLSKTLAAISTGTFVEPSPLTVDEYLDKWLEAAAHPRVRERTFQDYKEYLSRYARPARGWMKLSDIRVLDMQKLYSDLLERGLGPRTVRFTHAILNSAFRQALRRGMLARNPCEFVELPRLSRREMQALTPKEAARFLEAAQSDRWGVIFKIALATGMRPEVKAAKLPQTFRVYDLRHTCATLLLLANEHPKVVSERLGHASAMLTLDVYSHVLPSMQRAASEKMEGILFGKTGTE